jgi:hypothetical protein
VNDRSEQRWPVLEAVVERSLRYARAPRDRFDAGRPVPVAQEQVRRDIEDALAERLRRCPRRTPRGRVRREEREQLLRAFADGVERRAAVGTVRPRRYCW